MDTLYTLNFYEGLDAEENPCSHFFSLPDIDVVRRSFLSQWEKAKRAIKLRDEPAEGTDDVVLIPGLELNFQQRVGSSEDALMELHINLVNGVPFCRVRVKSDRSTSSFLDIGNLRSVDPEIIADQLMDFVMTSDVMSA